MASSTLCRCLRGDDRLSWNRRRQNQTSRLSVYDCHFVVHSRRGVDRSSLVSGLSSLLLFFKQKRELLVEGGLIKSTTVTTTMTTTTSVTSTSSGQPLLPHHITPTPSPDRRCSPHPRFFPSGPVLHLTVHVPPSISSAQDSSVARLPETDAGLTMLLVAN